VFQYAFITIINRNCSTIRLKQLFDRLLKFFTDKLRLQNSLFLGDAIFLFKDMILTTARRLGFETSSFISSKIWVPHISKLLPSWLRLRTESAENC